MLVSDRTEDEMSDSCLAVKKPELLKGELTVFLPGWGDFSRSQFWGQDGGLLSCPGMTMENE